MHIACGHAFYVIKHRLQFPFTYFPVKFRAHRFQIDVGGIHHRQELFQGLGADITVGNEYRLEPFLAQQRGGVPYIFKPHQRLGIGKGHPEGILVQSGFDQFLRSNVKSRGFFL